MLAFLLFSVHTFAQSPLNKHPSPYLAMHADDPLQWHLWTPETLDKAHQQNKLILLSSGYFSCHWCHVMQAENYRNPVIAKLLNEHFISIKIDRELTPDIDRFMIEFAREHLGSAGWPQHLILLPNQTPIAGFTYLSSSSLNAYLTKLTTLWQNSPDTLFALSTSPAQSQENGALKPWATIQYRFAQALNEALIQEIDDFSGGLKGVNKFPESPLLLSLLQQPKIDSSLLDWLELTLEAMQNEHLHDHVNGGFYRYSIDPNWQTPHFEKMLYDNAQLLKIYALGAQKFQRNDFLQTAESTLQYIREQLYSPELKLYYGSQSALNHHGVEGGSYLWTREQLQTLFSAADYHAINRALPLDEPAPYEAGWHPKPTSQNWKAIQTRLKQARLSTIPRDDKAIISWNALLLDALNSIRTLPSEQLEGYPQLIQSPKYADELAKSLTTTLLLKQPPRAIAWRDQAYPLNDATLEDFAYGIKALTPYLMPKEIDVLTTQLRKFYTAPFWRLAQTQSQLEQTHFADDAVPSTTAITYCVLDLAMPEQLLLEQPIHFASYLEIDACSTIMKSLNTAN